MLYLSKSKYCSLWQCPKILWMNKHKSEELVLDSSALARMEAGNEVGDLAMGLFGDYVEVTAYKGERLNLQKMIADTKAEMDKGTPVKFDEDFALKVLKEKSISVNIDVFNGEEKATAWGCDLSYDYVKINGDYRS